MKKYIIILIILLISFPAYSSDRIEFLGFFNTLEKMGNSYDKNMANYYSDNAKITVKQVQLNGVEQITNVTGKKWKQLFLETLPIIKQKKYKSKFSNVRIKLKKNFAKITATRYDNHNCYTDKNYYVIVKKENNKFIIVKEYMETLANLESQCKNKDKDDDLEAFLKLQVAAFKSEIPMMVDKETKLVNVTSKGKMMIYHYVMINFNLKDIKTDLFEQTLEPTIQKTNCSQDFLKPVLEKGATLVHMYKSKDDKFIKTFYVNSKTCEALKK